MTNKKYYLARFQDDWADEMYIKGFVLLDEKGKKETLKRMKVNFDEMVSEGRKYEIGFGTNQSNKYDTFEEVLKTVSFKKITKQEHDTIKKLFGSSYGNSGPLA